MLFSVNLFIYVFLPLCTGIYYGVYKRLKNPRTATNLILLMFSWVFYFRELSETHENIVNLHIQIKYYADAEAGSMLKQAVMNIST